MIPVGKALKIVARETHSLSGERVALAESVGRVLAENIVADTDLPPFDRSQMDGYAVKAKDTENCPVTLKIVGESAAGRGWHKTLRRGEAVRIMTGAPVPVGADAVQKVELTSEKNNTVTLTASVKKETNVVRRGAEIKSGKTIFESGDVITENMIAVLASFGYAKVKVGKQPCVAILGTGSEIVDIARKPGRDQIRNSNSLMLDVLARRFGCKTSIIPMVKDDIAEIKKAIRSASNSADVLVITGGVSVGKYDHTTTALSELGAEIFFEKVALKPGKPTVFARLGKTMIFGLPGNPVSAAVTFYLFVRKALLHKQAATTTDLEIFNAVVSRPVKGTKERDSYIPARLITDDKGRLITEAVRWQGSSDFIGFSSAECLIVVPNGSSFDVGDVVKIVRF